MKSKKIKDGKRSKVILSPLSINKNIVQSYAFTTAKYDFSVYEKRVLYRIIECLQSQLNEKKIDKGFSINKNSSGDVDIAFPISSLLLNEEDKNYYQIKNAFLSLKNKNLIYENNKEWEPISLIERPKIKKYHNMVELRLHPKIYEVLFDFSKGFRKYELKTAISFSNVYAMRFYEILSGQKKPMKYQIDELKTMFQLENKYKKVSGFISRVIDPAKRELDLKSSYSFTYQLEYKKEREQKGRKKITGIILTPIRCHPSYRKEVIALQEGDRVIKHGNGESKTINKVEPVKSNIKKQKTASKQSKIKLDIPQKKSGSRNVSIQKKQDSSVALMEREVDSIQKKEKSNYWNRLLRFCFWWKK